VVGREREGAATGGEGASDGRGIRGGTGECRRDGGDGGRRGEGGNEHKIGGAWRGRADDIKLLTWFHEDVEEGTENKVLYD
jgi:hypothetical protein